MKPPLVVAFTKNINVKQEEVLWERAPKDYTMFHFIHRIWEFPEEKGYSVLLENGMVLTVAEKNRVGQQPMFHMAFIPIIKYYFEVYDWMEGFFPYKNDYQSRFIQKDEELQ